MGGLYATGHRSRKNKQTSGVLLLLLGEGVRGTFQNKYGVSNFTCPMIQVWFGVRPPQQDQSELHSDWNQPYKCGAKSRESINVSTPKTQTFSALQDASPSLGPYSLWRLWVRYLPSLPMSSQGTVAQNQVAHGSPAHRRVEVIARISFFSCKRSVFSDVRVILFGASATCIECMSEC